MLVKVWAAFLVMVTAAAVGLAILAPRPNDRELARVHAARLDQSQHVADMLMRRASRDFLDTTVRLGQDRTLIEAFEHANTNRFDAATLRGRINARLDTLRRALPQDEQPDLMIALGASGETLGRVGTGADRVRREQGMLGYPLIAGALQGYLLDDIWSYDGRMYQMAGVPVISRDRSGYVGALVVGKRVAEHFVKTLKSGLDNVDVAFFLRGKLLASTVASEDIARLPQQYAQPKRREAIAQAQRSSVFTIGDANASFQVILAPVRGSAHAHDGFYALISPPPPKTGLLVALNQITPADLAFGAFPWITLGTVLLLLLGFTVALLYLLHDRPLNRLVGAAYRIVRGDATQVADAPFRGPFFHLARAINEIAGRVGKPGIGGATAAKGKSATAEKMPSPPARISDLTLDNHVSLTNAGEMDGAMLASLGATIDERGAGMPLDQLPMGAPGMMGFPRPEEEESPTGLHFGEQPPDDAAGLPLLAPVSLPSESSKQPTARPAPFSAPAMLSGFVLGGDDPGPGQTANGDDNNFSSLPELPSLDNLGNAPAPQPLPDWAAGHPGNSAPDLGLPHLSPFPATDTASSLLDQPAPFAPTAQAPQTKTYPAAAERAPAGSAVSPAPLPESSGEEAEHFKQVFSDFLATKRRCGEPTDNITLERFVAKLKKNRASLVERYNCKAVRFQVYVKDGKAAVKATPVKD